MKWKKIDNHGINECSDDDEDPHVLTYEKQLFGEWGLFFLDGIIIQICNNEINQCLLRICFLKCIGILYAQFGNKRMRLLTRKETLNVGKRFMSKGSSEKRC